MDTATRRFWLLWILASALGGGAITVVARAAAYSVGYAVGESGGYVVGEIALGIVAAGSVMGIVGIAQWLVLRWREPWAVWWPVASIVGGASAGAVLLGINAALGGEGATAALTGGVFGFAVFAAVHWLTLRRHVQGAAWLAAASAVGWPAAGMIGGGLAAVVGGGEIGAGVGFGAVYGLITGGTLVALASRGAPAAARRVA